MKPNPLIILIVTAVAFCCYSGCASNTETATASVNERLLMNSKMDLSVFPEGARKWLVEYESKCISLSEALDIEDESLVKDEKRNIRSHLRTFRNVVAGQLDGPQTRAFGHVMTKIAEQYNVRKHLVRYKQL
jgi:hypothetical protein